MDLSIDLRNQFCKKPEKSLRKVRSAISFSQRQIKFTLERFSDPSLICLRAQPLKNSAGRVPQAADGTCKTLANQILPRTFFRSVAHLFACPAVEKFCRASSAGGRRHLQ
jgi:hypothetical protein